MELRFVKSIGKEGNIGYRVYINGKDGERDTLEKAWARLEKEETIDGFAVKVNDKKYIIRGKSSDDKAFAFIYALDNRCSITDITKEDLDELVNKLRNEIENIRKVEEYTYIL